MRPSKQLAVLALAALGGCANYTTNDVNSVTGVPHPVSPSVVPTETTQPGALLGQGNQPVIPLPSRAPQAAPAASAPAGPRT